VAFFNLARRKAKLREARKITTYVAILSSHPCEVAACRENQHAAKGTPAPNRGEKAIHRRPVSRETCYPDYTGP